MLGSECSGLRALYSTGETESLRVFKEGGCGGLECCLAEIFLASVSRDGQSCGDSRQEVCHSTDRRRPRPQRQRQLWNVEEVLCKGLGPAKRFRS